MPEVENFCGGVRVAIERTKFLELIMGRVNTTPDVTSNVVSDVVSQTKSQLTERQTNICKIIRENPFVSAKDLAEALSVAARTAQRDLANMQKNGIIMREGNTSAGHWVLLI